ncbi:hypothetical protein PV721_31870, partial [Streptomyces sp. MB09-01]|nr:hypothetical protein [Streptomyces sp. MB09-01]
CICLSGSGAWLLLVARLRAGPPANQLPGGPARNLATSSSQALTTPNQPNPPATQATRRHQPRHQIPTQPAVSPRQQQLRQRLDRGTQRQPGTRHVPTATPRRPSDASLSHNEERELNIRRRRQRRS